MRQKESNKASQNEPQIHSGHLFEDLTHSYIKQNRTLAPYQNESLIDFQDNTLAQLYEMEVRALRETSKFPEAVVGLIAGQVVPRHNDFVRHAAGEKDKTIASISCASSADVEEALKGLRAESERWARTSPENRVDMLLELASLIKQERLQLAALIGLEVGKNRVEADAEIAEAIDFCEYYARQALELAQPMKTMDVAGEENFLAYRPRGVVSVIAPWNFPFAIPCGMVGAALVTGNTVAFKPAEQSSVLGQRLVQLFQKAGFPPEVLAFLPGTGEEAGRALVRSAQVDIIVFTGSKEVGLEIQRTAAEVHPGQRNIKRVITELGGKNSLIVDEGVDLAKVIPAIMSSAFGYGGQKCSSLSRLIVVGDQYETLLEHLSKAAAEIKVGSWEDPKVTYGPLIDEDAAERIRKFIEIHGANLRKLFVGSPNSDDPSFVGPHIFADVPFDSPMWTTELFGPVLSCARADSFKAALDIANRSEYALTGGVFSNSTDNLLLAATQFRAGNLYFNRKITGALVGRQPFGGFGMSGVGSKAGGPDYLLQFVDPVSICHKMPEWSPQI
jgi:RHH-type proline utilization regulon transcriptional repressor/proline dehydrogenase/delta 1-pyrroline-5-carboxylate dehydrogenase